ncbi:MAG: oxidoreductase [Verrucomicrobiales bacterium]|nr:oxidoreductase [Verrucomicrobiales bacterium]|tara:strand:+ start:396 stop:1685 length:1290 start_codon:yes stop_codon:yes gene_type:complete
MNEHIQIKRRRFLGQSAVASGLLVFDGLFSRVRAANNKLSIGVVGVAGRGGRNLNGVSEENITALCDVDTTRLAAAKKGHPGAATYTDWRKMLERKDLDAVVCSTPDHTHAVIGVNAMKAGHHLYCEKPLTHTVSEARAMAETAAKHKRVTQMGTQIHAGENYRRVVEAVQSGLIGPVKEVHVWANAVYGNVGLSAPSAPPENLDYDLWLGPLPYRPFRKEYAPFHWRHFWAFGGGTLADFWCHFSDLTFWALDLKYPDTVHCHQGEVRPERATVQMRVKYEYPARGKKPPVTLHWYQGGDKPDFLTDEQRKKWKSGVMFFGDKGQLFSNYGSHQVMLADAAAEVKPPKPYIPKSIGHHAEWIKACKEGGATTCHFGYAGPLTESALLGIVSHRVGNKKLEWDAKQLKATNCPEADQFIHHKYRKGWSL